jgi:hypothetical protein
MEQIHQKSSTASDALIDGMIAIMATFPAYKHIDFFEGTNNNPMMASEFFGIAALATRYNNEINKRSKKGK